MSDAAEVAEDYRHALEDLSSNMRHEISNLTVIARENTEHALTIAEVLQTHILKVGVVGLISHYSSYVHLLTSPGRPKQETAIFVCAGFDCQKCRHTVYPLLWTHSLQDLYGVLCSRGPADSTKDGGDAQDMERSCAWIYG